MEGLSTLVAGNKPAVHKPFLGLSSWDGTFQGSGRGGRKNICLLFFFFLYFFSPYAFSFFPSLTKAVVSFKMSNKEFRKLYIPTGTRQNYEGAMTCRKTKFALVYCIGLYLSGLLHSVYWALVSSISLELN